MTFRLCRVAKQAPDKRGVVMTKIIAPKCPGPKRGFFDRGLVPCIAFDHAPGGAVALWKSETFLWLGIVTLSCKTGNFITTYETHF